MKIRDLRKDEISDVIPLCEAFCKEMGFPFNGESCAQTLENAINNAGLVVAIVDDSQIIGLAGAVKMPSYTDYKALRAVEFIWHTNPALSAYKRAKAMALSYKAMETWANRQRLPFSISVCNQASRDFLERKGYGVKEYHYGREVI